MEKTIYTLEPHETLVIPTTVGGKLEITRVPGGWIYAFDYVGYRQSPIMFVPFCKDEGFAQITPKKEPKVKKVITKTNSELSNY